MDLNLLIPQERELLLSLFLFRGMEGAAVEGYLADGRCTLEVFPRRQDIYTPAHFRRSLGFVLSGAAAVRKDGLPMSTLGPGECFGAAALYTQRAEYETTITAVEPCRVLFLPQDLVDELLCRHSAAAQGYIRYLSQRIHFLNRKLEGLLAPGPVEKLGRYLLAVQGESVECAAADLARRLDVSRSSLYRAFAALEQTGAIRRRGKRIEILDREPLTTK